jgi:putative two-component system response regulator
MVDSATVLIVDDNAVMRELLVQFVEAEGYRTIQATNGREALQAVQRYLPDLVLLDVTMPDMDGYAVCRTMKGNEQTALIPVTMLTILDDLEHRRRGLEAGADDFLSKPFDKSLLRARIRSQLQTKRLTDQLERTESVIFALALAVEAKDLYTEGHIRRLAHYSEQLALAAGLSADEAKIIRYGGFLHDIGKIGVDDAILRKPAPLARKEYQHVKLHPELGARIIAPMRFARQVAPIVLGHHENWDGTGYPYGLKGNQIAVGARIVAIVDAFDAMTTDRPYRRAYTHEQALVRMQARSGVQWDAELFQIFAPLIEREYLTPPPMPREFQWADSAALVERAVARG